MTMITSPSIPRISTLRSLRLIGAHVLYAWRTVRLPPRRAFHVGDLTRTQRTPSARELVLRSAFQPYLRAVIPDERDQLRGDFEAHGRLCERLEHRPVEIRVGEILEVVHAHDEVCHILVAGQRDARKRDRARWIEGLLDRCVDVDRGGLGGKGVEGGALRHYEGQALQELIPGEAAAVDAVGDRLFGFEARLEIPVRAQLGQVRVLARDLSIKLCDLIFEITQPQKQYQVHADHHYDHEGAYDK